tara:strand:+ start:6718 stop:7038 length:321 start_codon:yes stop_codon:yes gene_type:complete
MCDLYISDDEIDSDNEIIDEVQKYISGEKKCKYNNLPPSCTIRSDTNLLIDMFFSDIKIKIMNYGYTGDGRYQFYYYRDNENNKYEFYTYGYVNYPWDIRGLKKYS